MTAIKLNPSQEQASQEIYKFLLSDEPAMVLTGKPGTGKSFLINHLISELLPKYENTCKLLGLEPVITELETSATTNKAATLIEESIGVFATTTHSCYNLVLRNDYRTGEMVITRNKRNWKIKQNTLIIIDEYTYINKQLFKEIIDGTDFTTSKIIFVGDKNQITPVKESWCVVDKQGYRTVELTEAVRNGSVQGLVEACESLKESVEKGVLKTIPLTPNEVEFITASEAGKLIEKEFARMDHNNKILAFNNNTVIAYNEYIRSTKGLGKMYSVGERLILNQSIVVSSSGSKKVLNSEIPFTVKNVNTKVAQHSYIMQDGTELLLPYYTINTKEGFFFMVPCDINQYRSMIKFMSKAKDWTNYFHLKESFADLRPSDASTVHKSQGSTYDRVYIDIDDLMLCRSKDLVRRLLYVAVSRAKEKVTFFGDTDKFKELFSYER